MTLYQVVALLPVRHWPEFGVVVEGAFVLVPGELVMPSAAAPSSGVQVGGGVLLLCVGFCCTVCDLSVGVVLSVLSQLV